MYECTYEYVNVVYAQFFAMNRTYMELDMRISTFLAKYKHSRYVVKQTMDDNIFDVIFAMLSRRQHCCFILSHKGTLIGTITMRANFDLILFSKKDNEVDA